MRRRRILPVCTLLLSLALLQVSPASARVLEVKPDGSVEYSILQDALSAAATGDTILVHPGAYTNTTRRWHGGAYREAVGFIESGVTIMAETYAGTIRVPSSVSAESAVGLYSVTSDSLSVHTLRFQGETSVALAIQGGGPALVDSCQFDGTRLGVATGAPGSRGWVRECEFRDTDGILTAAAGWSRTWDCTFVNPSESINEAFLVVHAGSYAEIFDCTLENGVVAQVNTGAYGVIQDFTATGLRGGALVRDPGSLLELDRVFMQGLETKEYTPAGLINNHRGELVATNVSVVNFQRAFEFSAPGPTKLRDSHILDWKWRAVHIPFPNNPPPQVIDLRENWWGTTDSTAIAGAVWDSHDESEITENSTIVEFWPVAPGPVPTEKETVGHLKAMYRSRSEQ